MSVRRPSSQTIALWFIGAILAADFSLNNIRPVALLAVNRDAYFTASRACYDARSYWRVANAVAAQQDGRTAEALSRSSAIAMLECHPHDVLRARLLSVGVGEDALDKLDLEAELHSAISLPSLAATSGE